jgi:hypothetical protein
MGALEFDEVGSVTARIGVLALRGASIGARDLLSCRGAVEAQHDVSVP